LKKNNKREFIKWATSNQNSKNWLNGVVQDDWQTIIPGLVYLLVPPLCAGLPFGYMYENYVDLMGLSIVLMMIFMFGTAALVMWKFELAQCHIAWAFRKSIFPKVQKNIAEAIDHVEKITVIREKLQYTTVLDKEENIWFHKNILKLEPGKNTYKGYTKIELEKISSNLNKYLTV